MTWLNEIHVGEAEATMHRMAADGVKVQCIVTSPPYWGLRSYDGNEGMIGLESSMQEWVAAITRVFDAAWDVLLDDGILWVNLGDAYVSGGGGGHQGKHGQRAKRSHTQCALLANNAKRTGLRHKSLMGQPWRIAFALMDAGWILRKDIILRKLNPTPESTLDRPSTAHEYLFMFVKSPRYKYRRKAIQEPTTGNAHPRRKNGGMNPKVAAFADGPGSHSTLTHASDKHGNGPKFGVKARKPTQNPSKEASLNGGHTMKFRNARSVWDWKTEPFKGKFYAAFPSFLPRRCILASTDPGDTVLDPFSGSGTTCEVACQLGRNYIGIEISPRAVKMSYLYRNFQSVLI